MNFNKLFGKKDKGSKPQPQDNNGQIDYNEFEKGILELN